MKYTIIQNYINDIYTLNILLKKVHTKMPKNVEGKGLDVLKLIQIRKRVHSLMLIFSFIILIFILKIV